MVAAVTRWLAEGAPLGANIQKGYVKKLTVEEAEVAFGRPALSRPGLIIKDKLDGTKKRRIIVDARRSGANHRARCPERIVLPRPEDVHYMLRNMKEGESDLLASYRSEQWSTADWVLSSWQRT